ncbi:DUF2891 domain-containing protein [Streptomyces sp. NRRL F-5126]|uniref:DUF2891 domain-containing protein n=1 Tax=Streptomyces sp. NRRL F-5126 TaxID=1463857 RepID=UPI00055A19FB|nr:DUF2891 domain-containing protein [Streptomyces sp. NRRL F-5126]
MNAAPGAPGAAGGPPPAALAPHAETFARLAVANITREYPNFPAHLLAGPEELVAPRIHHPAFYGAYDWHSSVHMHWLAMRLLRHGLPATAAGRATEALDAHLTAGALATEAGYLRDHPSFERPYGWAWLLMLTAESAAHDDGRWFTALAPAARTVADLVLAWLPKARYPVRHGTHANSAFALGLVLDSAERAAVPDVVEPVRAKLRAWFEDDRAGALRWEPSGQDFLSPLLTEADAFRRVAAPGEFTGWMSSFLPELTEADREGRALLLEPPEVTDHSDGQIGHLHGLCFSRAAALHTLADALGDSRSRILRDTASAHLDAGMSALGSGDFTTDHWLATFAVLALEPAATDAPA